MKVFQASWKSWPRSGGVCFFDLEKVKRSKSKVVSTHLWNTPLNLYQPAISRASFHSWPGGLPGVCSRGVL